MVNCSLYLDDIVFAQSPGSKAQGGMRVGSGGGRAAKVARAPEGITLRQDNEPASA